MVVNIISEVKKPDPYLTHGQYQGVWGGYHVHVTIDGRDYEFLADHGIRTPAAPCIVTVGPDGITVRAIESRRRNDHGLMRET